MIRGKKIRKPLRKLKIQEKAEMEQELTPDFIDENEELTMLSAVDLIVTLAEDSELSSLFFEKADRLFSLSQVPQATNLISRMSLDTLIVTAYRCYSIKERWMTW